MWFLHPFKENIRRVSPLYEFPGATIAKSHSPGGSHTDVHCPQSWRLESKIQVCTGLGPPEAPLLSM